MLPGRTYGDAPSAVSATASSGLPVSFSVVSGPASVSVISNQSSVISLSGAGVVTVRASQAGDTNWNGATPVDQSFIVAKAALTVTADDKSRGYGQTNPVFAGQIIGLQAGDNITATYDSAA